uniref:Probable 28S rRNA (Cytosine-C(5))-methyltransferase n=1 Tax=Diabrotica virgifera virgifera TaxID=50390 RepID=A0A6P7GQY4_DIAVI
MKIHSVKVPRLYKVAAEVAKEVGEGIGSIKTLVYEKKKKHPNIKAIYALVSTLFQKLREIETLLKRSQLLIKETKFNPWLAKVLIVELLWGKTYLPGQSKPENTIRAYEQIFKAHLSDSTVTEIEHKDKGNKPRYVRINTLFSNLDEAVESFREDGWVLNRFLNKNDYNGFLEIISSLKEGEFMIDIHVPNLLVFPPKTEFYRHPAYKNGSIILQDKASCLPVHVLNPPPGSTVLDMCAAPGMKTTHLAAVLNNQGTVYATERNPRRFEVLNNIVDASGATCIKTFNKDVLDCTKADFPDVEYILVDPSCSGTGMTDRAQENEITPSRLASLTGFQVKILRHALTKFPSAKRVVYSTCSIMAEENEDVVRQVLETNYNFKLISASQFVGETWHSFGSSDYGDIGKFCLYAKPDSDYTNGFFVAIFERLQEAEENQFFNTRIFNFKKHVQENEKWKLKKQKKYNQNLTNIEFGENHAHQTGNRKENKKMQNVHINKDGKQNDKCSNNSKKHNQNEVIPKYKQNKTKNYTDDASTELEKYENINILEKEENLKIKRKVAKADHDNLESKQLKKSKNKKTKSFDLQIDCERLENRTPECIGKTSIISNNKKSKKFKQVDIGLGSDIIASKHVGVTNESKINTKKIKRQNIAETIDVDKETEIISKKEKRNQRKYL